MTEAEKLLTDTRKAYILLNDAQVELSATVYRQEGDRQYAFLLSLLSKDERRKWGCLLIGAPSDPLALDPKETAENLDAGFCLPQEAIAGIAELEPECGSESERDFMWKASAYIEHHANKG